MKKFKTVFYSIYFLYLIVTFILVPLDPNKILSFLVNNMEIIPYWIGFGVLMYIAIWVIENIHIRMLKTKNHALEKERDALKIKMYDMEAKYEEVESSMKSFNQSLPKKNQSEEDK